ncbi:hypothetical protein BATDEDRAFT_24622 [Batrachochytrium dendrobatidis JAM81]|uniref:Mitochondrial zinc maintenance protein 1, mitochondrial n=2 Tax=Batrachochytrium dendrobatidis TaxID=109871 RepID=F4P1W8_BATDJ|nr:uncharacterized protein BATDEDRAFT_24622 [Batrachochytrium dendrobatidis JAM81]EGF81009.1 hypothetical protein BATDEDRAFT_24622 [Batrachochytrium dendrobatidis JAM81]KAJ8328986.1 hypothetical protein O5D80_002947 [Batrachochytrium dendrobatidis]KAK5668938.1 hypothetical protein QVD99_004712 [Batrachochytrium dendrobatidis]OAJ41853.1 hypothetical protein BDEG_25389 [Batrachochytrium dendrobatidis JEL423]|eukprot:XP_006678501.1 hypothetical protein BATDEDRAFT_24622 [Batrachochytrium dendrobatidis JAM81]
MASMFLPSTNASVLSTYRGLLREVNRQFVVKNNNSFWRMQVIAQFRIGKGITDPSRALAKRRQAQNVLMYLKSSREYKELMERYWPVSTLTEQEKIAKTANRVGLAVPKPVEITP